MRVARWLSVLLLLALLGCEYQPHPCGSGQEVTTGGMVLACRFPDGATDHPVKLNVKKTR